MISMPRGVIISTLLKGRMRQYKQIRHGSTYQKTAATMRSSFCNYWKNSFTKFLTLTISSHSIYLTDYAVSDKPLSPGGHNEIPHKDGIVQDASSTLFVPTEEIIQTRDNSDEKERLQIGKILTR